ncbi:uncharacterized protein LOC120342776 [Styela clava]
MYFAYAHIFIITLSILLRTTISSDLQGHQDFRPTMYVPTKTPVDNNFEFLLERASSQIRSLHGGRYYKPSTSNLFQGSFFVRRHCKTIETAEKLWLYNGYADLYCVQNDNYLMSVFFQLLPQEGLQGEPTTGWFAARTIMEAYGIVPVCGTHCVAGTKPSVLPGNYTMPTSKSFFSVGCADVVLASCRDVCPDDIYTLDNGIVSCVLDTQVGSKCTAKCNKGYVSVGPDSRSCNRSKKWVSKEPFKCLVENVGNAVKSLMEDDNLTVDEAMAELRKRLERHVSKNRASPSTRRHESTVSDEEKADEEIVKLMEEMLISLSESVPITLKYISFSECSVNHKERVDCGYGGIPPNECKSRGCCWDASVPNTKWCFRKKNRRPTPMNYTTKSTTKYPVTTLERLNTRGMRPAPTFEEVIPTPGFPAHDYVNPFRFPSIDILTLGKPDSEEECGCVNRQVARCGLMPLARIYCGQTTFAETWPWHAVVYHGERLCGGTIISKQWILTAAHCLTLIDGVTDSDPSNIVYLGLSRRDQSNPTTRKMKRVVRHPLFHSRGDNFIQNDIALIQLKEPLEYSDSIRKLCLPGKNKLLTAKNCHITGFGKKTPEGEPSVTLQTAELPIISTEECALTYGDRVNPIQNICAGSSEKDSTDTCKGDSGGPLACQAEEGNGCSWYLAGVTSFGKEPCGGGWPGVYVNVSHYEDWILSYIRPFWG